MSTKCTLAIGQDWHLYEDLFSGDVLIDVHQACVSLTIVLPRDAVAAIKTHHYSDDDGEVEP